MEIRPKRIKGIEYPSSLSLILRKREYIPDIDGLYKILDIDPNEKPWSSLEIKERFRQKVKKSPTNLPKLIEAYRTLTSTKRVVYDSLTKTLDRLVDELNDGKVKLVPKVEVKEDPSFAYFVDKQDEDYSLALEWMKTGALFYHRTGRKGNVKIVLSDHFEEEKYSWGTLMYVNTNFEPALDVLAFHLLKDTKENWYLDYCKVIRNWN